MKRYYPTEITLSLGLADSGTFTAAQALNWANVTIDDGAEYEIDRKRLCEDNDDFDAHVEMVGKDEVVHFTRIGGGEEKLGVIIRIHY